LQQGQETKVIVRYNHSQKTTTQQLLATPIFLENGESLMLGDVATLHFEQHAEVLYRRNQEQVVNLYWRQDRSVQSPEEVLAKLQPIFKDIEQRYPGVSIKPDGEFEELGEVQAGFKSAMIMTLVLIYILLAVPLKSYWQPMIIMAVIPFGFAGAIFGHGLMGLPLSILSMFGMMAMTGIVVNDSLVLITRFNQYYRAGMPLKQALIKAGTSRVRAIFLTTITTVCGLLPLLLESAEQAQYLKPAAVSLVFGELFATGVTLVIIPTLLGVFTRRDVAKLNPKVAVFNS
jgi:multidrug efflux pump subunit AcrB